MGSTLHAFSGTASIMKSALAILAFVSLTRALPLDDGDPNDDAEVFSGPFDSGAGDYDTDYGFPFPRVRVFLIPVSPGSGQNEDYDDYPETEFRGPPIDSLFSVLQSFFGLRPEPEGNAETDSEPCLLCDVLDDSFKSVQEHIDGVRDSRMKWDWMFLTLLMKMSLMLTTQPIQHRFLMMGQLSIST